MNAPPPRLARTLKPWLFAALGALSLTGACSDDDETEATPTTYSIEVVGFDGADEAKPHCDGTLTVDVSISPGGRFSLRPPHACGASGACGYVRAEGLTADDEVLAKNESVTTSLVLELEPARLAELKKVRVSLVRGADGELVKNPDGAEVTTQIEPAITLPTGCEDLGSGGAGGQASGGAGGQPSGGTPSAGGQGGATDGGAGGQGGIPNGGAANGGAANGGAGGEPLGGATN